jgi:hypothetical protein
MRLNVDVAQLTSIMPSYRTLRNAKRSGAPRHRGPRRCAQAHAALAPAARSIRAKSAPVSAGFCTRAFDRAASQRSHWKGCRGEARHHEFLSQHALGCKLSGFGPHRSRSGRRLDTLCRRPDVLFCARGARHGSQPHARRVGDRARRGLCPASQEEDVHPARASTADRGGARRQRNGQSATANVAVAVGCRASLASRPAHDDFGCATGRMAGFSEYGTHAADVFGASQRSLSAPLAPTRMLNPGQS